jgi:DNA (cytosine-5)-methyltransferase 1
VRDALPWISKAIHDTSGQFSVGDITDRPAATVTTAQHHFVVDRDVEHGASIERFAIGDEWDKLTPGQQSDRFFSLVKPHPEQVSPTITASGGSASTAGVTHPFEKRKFSIPELRRICGFPDDFILTGTYAQQWERLGRAVPPVMMSHIAATVRDQILSKVK